MSVYLTQETDITIAKYLQLTAQSNIIEGGFTLYMPNNIGISGDALVSGGDGNINWVQVVPAEKYKKDMEELTTKINYLVDLMKKGGFEIII